MGTQNTLVYAQQQCDSAVGTLIGGAVRRIGGRKVARERSMSLFSNAFAKASSSESKMRMCAEAAMP